MAPPSSYSKWDNLVDSDSEAEDAAPVVAADQAVALLERGNTAMQWLQRNQSGESISAILSADIAAMEALEQDLLEGGLG